MGGEFKQSIAYRRILANQRQSSCRDSLEVRMRLRLFVARLWSRMLQLSIRADCHRPTDNLLHVDLFEGRSGSFWCKPCRCSHILEGRSNVRGPAGSPRKSLRFHSRQSNVAASLQGGFQGLPIANVRPDSCLLWAAVFVNAGLLDVLGTRRLGCWRTHFQPSPV